MSGAVAAYEPLRSRITSIVVEWTEADPTTAGGWRNQALVTASGMMLDNWSSGVGLGQFRAEWYRYAPSSLAPPLPELTPDIHNAYLGIGIELGLPGLLSLVAVILVAWRVVRGAQRNFRRGGNIEMLNIAHAAEVAWVATAASLMLYPTVDQLRYFWLLLALIGGVARVGRDSPQPDRAMGPSV